jgi:hypothetical protein
MEDQVMTLEGLDDLGITVKQTAAENPFLTQVLAASILIMVSTLIGRAKDRGPAAAPLR